MPTWVRVHDTTNGYEYDVDESSLPSLPPEVVPIPDSEVTGRLARPRPPSYDASAPEPVRDPDMPAPSATKREWAEYAVSRGMDESTAESLTRDGLAAHFTEENR